MGIFSRLFQGPDKQVEAELEELYSKACVSYSGQSISEARRTVREAIKGCKEQAQQEGTDKLPENFGTLLTTKSKELRDMGFTIVQNARADGACDEDIEEW